MGFCFSEEDCAGDGVGVRERGRETGGGLGAGGLDGVNWSLLRKRASLRVSGAAKI